LGETAQYLEGLRDAISRSDPEAALEMLEGLVNSSANVGATRLMELCSKFANQRGPLEDCAPVLSELVEAHRNITNELQDMYSAYRFDGDQRVSIL
jgi:hypothetical protein